MLILSWITGLKLCEIFRRLWVFCSKISSRYGITGMLDDTMTSPTASTEEPQSSPTNIVYRIIQTDEDRAKVFEFMQHVFRLNEPITSSLGSTEEDTYEFFKAICESNFKDPYSILAEDATTNEVAGICLNAICENLSNYGNPNVHPTDSNLPLECSEDIANGPFTSHNANRLKAIIDHVECAVREEFAGYNRVFKLDILGVNPKFGGKGIGKRLTSELLKLARQYDCQAIFTCATARASSHIFEKFGFKTVRAVSYALFQENGSAVFHNLHDGGTEAVLKILRLS